jgi:hypothetical protein
LGSVRLLTGLYGAIDAVLNSQDEALFQGRTQTTAAGLRGSAGAAFSRTLIHTDIVHTSVTGLTLGTARLRVQGRAATLVARATLEQIRMIAATQTVTDATRLSEAVAALTAASDVVSVAHTERRATAAAAASSVSATSSGGERRTRDRVRMYAAPTTEMVTEIERLGAATLRANLYVETLYEKELSPSIPFDQHHPEYLGRCYRGDTITLPVWQAIDLSGNVVDLTGASLWFTAKVDLAVADATTPTIQCSTTNGYLVVLDAPTGLYQATIQPSQTHPLTGDTVFTYDVQVITSEGVTRTIRWGTIIIVRDVTRAAA